ncbi:hypothetical protein Pla52n_55740 [Stieleria varia]|uniref:Uncharacterized protein n=1 Tax=Stieleria varia TaxID=2528005 RepID=A0A5C6A2X3_9BACT|nr:hypothetical protein Pla52n_55740 [Stieleria varia]
MGVQRMMQGIISLPASTSNSQSQMRRQRKTWGVNPMGGAPPRLKSRDAATDTSRILTQSVAASAACLASLRNVTWDLRPRLYAFAASAAF